MWLWGHRQYEKKKKKQQNQRTSKIWKTFWVEDPKKSSGLGFGQEQVCWLKQQLQGKRCPAKGHACFLPAVPMPGSRWQDSLSLCQPGAPPSPVPAGTTDWQWGRRHQTQHVGKQRWRNPNCCRGTGKTLMRCGGVFHEPATTAPNKPNTRSHQVEWPLSIGWLGWWRLQFPWEDSAFQNLGSIDPGQHMSNSAAVSHDGCCLPRNTTETVRLPRNIKGK